MKRSNLDEMQEQKLLKIERNGCWLTFWLLLGAMVVQALLGRGREVLGEWIIFMVLALYLCVACAHAGIWDRRLKMDGKTNLLISLVAGLCAGVFMWGYTYLRYHALHGSLAAGAIMAGSTFVLCLLALAVLSRVVRKRQEQLNKEPEE